MATRLTENAKAGGCAAKLSPKILDQVLRNVPRFQNSNVLVGFDTSDDAGIYSLEAEAGSTIALVQTIDFFTPIVDDPFTFGAIAAANALSDIYAMGGRPITALSVVVYPAKGPLADLEGIMQGGAAKMIEGSCAVLGGHSISDEQIKFGYAVTGLVEKNRYWTNAGAQAGDLLVFTKKLGTGVIASALKAGFAESGDVQASLEQMLTLNRDAAEVLRTVSVHACTDVTGFGLLGHAREMALASNVSLEINVLSLQLLPGALDYAGRGAISAGLRNNRDFVESCVAVHATLQEPLEALLYDPQTSGGLLAALPPDDAERFLRECPQAYVIGQVLERGAKPLQVVG